MPVPRLCYAIRQRAEPFRRASPAQKKAPLSKGDSPQCGEMSRSDRGARARRAGRVSGLGDSDGPCLIARYTRRRPGIPPPRLRSAPPFDKGGFSRGLRPRKRLPTAWGAGRASRPEGLCRVFRRRPVTPLPPNPLLSPNSTPTPSLSQNFTNFTRSTQNLPPLCKTFTAIVPYYGRNRRKTAVQLACFR